jgi:hypothetical protein
MEVKEAVSWLVNNLAATMIAIITVAGIIAKIRPVGNSVKRFLFAELYAANEKQDRRLDNLEMQQLKQIICDRRLPVGERLKAGDEYRRRGGNGEIAVIYDVLQETAKKERLEHLEKIEQEQAALRRLA